MAESATKAILKFKAIGEVQGVSFRYYTQKEAQKLGLVGWCHNHPDESVEGAVYGEEGKVQEFRKYLSSGPPSATVNQVQYSHETQNPSQEHVQELLGSSTAGFDVRRFGEGEGRVRKGPPKS